MSDLIDRQAALERLQHSKPEVGSDGSRERYRYMQWMADRNAIKEVPSAQPGPHWIPCSERYPDMDERVLVYTGAHEYHVWDCMSNRADNYFWEDDEGLYHGKYEVDLWMPLLEPYQGGEQHG